MDPIQIIKLQTSALIAETAESAIASGMHQAAKNLYELADGGATVESAKEIPYLCKDLQEMFRGKALLRQVVNFSPISAIQAPGAELDAMSPEDIIAMVELHASPKTIHPAAKPQGDAIFVGHGRSPLYLKVIEFLTNKFDAEILTFEARKRGGLQVVDILEGLIEDCGFAIIVATAEDDSTDGKRARQNVVHETGLFQGRLGFEKVAILKQEPSVSYSNLSGLLICPFENDEIESTFVELTTQLTYFDYQLK